MKSNRVIHSRVEFDMHVVTCAIMYVHAALVYTLTMEL